MMTTETYFINTPLGSYEFILENEHLTKFALAPHKKSSVKKSALANKVADEIDAYFSNPKHEWNIPLKLNVTPFREKVLNALCEIPAGSTLTYGELARKLKTAPRAIGQACRTNPIPIIIPCHRIVAANHLGGYAGETAGDILAMKKWLLAHESSV